MKKTLVLGASPKENRYSYHATAMLKKQGHEIVAVGRKSISLAGWDILDGTPAFSDIDTVTLYLNPTNQQTYYNYVLSLKPRRVIFNPGTENPEFATLLAKNGIEAEIACTLVLLSTEQY